jgi:hypothetical protein
VATGAISGAPVRFNARTLTHHGPSFRRGCAYEPLTPLLLPIQAGNFVAEVFNWNQKNCLAECEAEDCARFA